MKKATMTSQLSPKPFWNGNQKLSLPWRHMTINFGVIFTLYITNSRDDNNRIPHRGKCNCFHEITLLMIFFFYCLLWCSIFSISFNHEEPIHDFVAFTSHKVFKMILFSERACTVLFLVTHAPQKYQIN